MVRMVMIEIINGNGWYKDLIGRRFNAWERGHYFTQDHQWIRKQDVKVIRKIKDSPFADGEPKGKINYVFR